MGVFAMHPQLQADTVIVGQFNLCWLLLHRDANYPWCILVPNRADIREIHQLTPDDRVALMRESGYLAEVLEVCFAPDKLNVAALGNMVPQLHVHHVVRYATDAAWPKPIWGAVALKPYEGNALAERVAVLQKALVLEGFKPLVDLP